MCSKYKATTSRYNFSDVQKKREAERLMFAADISSRHATQQRNLNFVCLLLGCLQEKKSLNLNIHEERFSSVKRGCTRGLFWVNEREWKFNFTLDWAKECATLGMLAFYDYTLTMFSSCTEDDGGGDSRKNGRSGRPLYCFAHLSRQIIDY